MSPTLKALMGWILVLVATTVVMDWNDAADLLRQESETSMQLRQKAERQTQTVNWRATADAARDAQNAWLDRLVPVETIGVFRAVAMERMAEVCNNVGVACQIGAEGEKVLNAPSKADNAKGEAAKGPAVPGLTSATVRVTLPAASPKLRTLITNIENGHDLRSIDRFTQRSGRIELSVQTYGIFVAQLDALRKTAASQGKGATEGESKP